MLLNPGYMSIVLLFIAFILVCSGWKEVFLKDVTDGGILLFFAAWLAGASVSIPLGVLRGGTVSLIVLPIAFVILASIRRMSRQNAVHLITYAVFLGATEALIISLRAADPMIVAANPFLQPDAAAILLVLVFTRHPLHQAAAASLALFTQDLASCWSVIKLGIPYELAGAGFQDRWWLQLFAIRLTSSTVEWLWRLSRRAFISILNKERGDRSDV